MTPMQDEPGLTENERAELNRLRAENAALRAQGQAAPQPPRPGGHQRWRTIVAVLLIVLGCVLAPLAGVAVWARNQVTNTDRYVATITPLASDPAIQQAITDQITAQVFTYIDIQALTTQVVDALSARVEGRGLPPQAAAALQGLAGPVANEVGVLQRQQHPPFTGPVMTPHQARCCCAYAKRRVPCRAGHGCCRAGLGSVLGITRSG